VSGAKSAPFEGVDGGQRKVAILPKLATSLTPYIINITCIESYLGGVYTYILCRDQGVGLLYWGKMEINVLSLAETYGWTLFMTLWAAWTVKQINRGLWYGVYSGLVCNSCFLYHWWLTGQYGFLVGDLIFTVTYLTEIRHNRGTR